MKTTISNYLKVSLCGLALSGAVIVSPSALAQSADNVRVLVMGEDSDPRSMKRSSTGFREVLSELKRSMAMHGFRMVDEEAVAVDLGWNITERRSKVELMQTIKAMNESKMANHQAPVMAVFSINSRMEKVGNIGNKISILIDGELYDIRSNQFLNSFDLPRKSYPAPADCGPTCASDLIRDNAGDIAAGVGDALGKQLAYLQSAPSQQTAGNDGGLNVPYTLVLSRVSTSEALGIIDTMSNEFPGYVTHDLIDKNPAVRRYSYTSSARPAKIEEWMNILLGDMGMQPGSQVEIMVDGTEIRVERLAGGPVVQPEAKGRFK
ncbi:MAG: hypothetical protein HWE12_06005 [Oceanospirillaceae bacterium]|nr:hypothetical protein [Oceanospirillaceae bacterium]